MGLPRGKSARASKERHKPVAAWFVEPVTDLPADRIGQYPKGFLDWAARATGLNLARCVHVFSGALPVGTPGVRVDIDPAVYPCVVADARELPFDNEAFDGALLDPPYTEDYAHRLYQTDYPSMAKCLNEAARVVVPGGIVAMLHYVVHNPPKGCSIEHIWGITTGTGFRIRAWTVYRKRDRDLFDSGSHGVQD